MAESKTWTWDDIKSIVKRIVEEEVGKLFAAVLDGAVRQEVRQWLNGAVDAKVQEVVQAEVERQLQGLK